MCRGDPSTSSPTPLTRPQQEFYISYFPFYIEQYCNKFGLLGLYFEIFPRDARKLRVALVCLSLYCTVGFIVTMCMVFFACPWGCYW